MPPAHAACLAMLGPVFTMQPDGERIYAPAGRLLETGETLAQPGLAAALELLADEGADSVYGGSIAELLAAVDGVPVTAADLARYEARWEAPAEVEWVGRRVLTRGGALRACRRRWRGCPASAGSTRPSACTPCSPRSAGPAADGHTTNLVTADAEGRVCVLTSSLGLGTGDFLPGLDLQLNSMLGEVDLVRAPLAAGRADGEHDGADASRSATALELAIGSAGGTRLRTALVGVAAGILDEELDPVAAVERPRFHRAGDVVNAEPGVDERALDGAGGDRAAGAPLAGRAPLLRRRQPDRDDRRSRRSAPEWARGDAAVSVAGLGSQPR